LEATREVFDGNGFDDIIADAKFASGRNVTRIIRAAQDHDFQPILEGLGLNPGEDFKAVQHGDFQVQKNHMETASIFLEIRSRRASVRHMNKIARNSGPLQRAAEKENVIL
jgi:hypothetical protein